LTLDILLQFIDILRDTTESVISTKKASLDIDALVAALRLVNNFNKHIKTTLITSRYVGKIANKEDI